MLEQIQCGRRRKNIAIYLVSVSIVIIYVFDSFDEPRELDPMCGTDMIILRHGFQVLQEIKDKLVRDWFPQLL